MGHPFCFLHFPIQFLRQKKTILIEEGAGRFSTVFHYGDGTERHLVEETVWQRIVAGDLGFDAEAHYPETMQVLDLGAEGPRWELRTADELRREDQQGHQSLREKYGKE